ncbi:MAG: aminotransferase class V-fold PLP-dependent enzyme [Planctomycetota bacterium]|nr:MAG: aminotransferase class V-fold PLP-dependent enzyme [Planctomycetota bacterium]
MLGTPEPILSSPAVVRQWLREQFQTVRNWAYFDHAAVAPIPVSARAAIEQYAQEVAESGDVHWPRWSREVEAARNAASKLINAETQEIALIPNTTYGVNVVAEGFPWQPGDNVVVPSNEFPTNLLPWKNQARRGVEIRVVPVPPGGRVDADLLAPYIDARTRVVAVSWVGFASGFRIDIGQIASLVHQRGGMLFLDAIQGLGPFALDVRNEGVDFLAADGHKWLLGPEGAGLLYIAREHLDLLQPLWIGWNSLAAQGFDPAADELKPDASRYEGGTYAMAAVLGFSASLQVLLHATADQVAGPVSAAVLENVARIAERLSRQGCTIELPPEQHRSGIVPVTWEGADAAALTSARRALLGSGVVTSVRGGRLRISTHAYNNGDDIDRLATALEEFRRR